MRLAGPWSAALGARAQRGVLSFNTSSLPDGAVVADLCAAPGGKALALATRAACTMASDSVASARSPGWLTSQTPKGSPKPCFFFAMISTTAECSESDL